MKSCESCIWVVTTESGDMFCEEHGIYVREDDEPCNHYAPFSIEAYVEAED